MKTWMWIALGYVAIGYMQCKKSGSTGGLDVSCIATWPTKLFGSK